MVEKMKTEKKGYRPKFFRDGDGDSSTNILNILKIRQFLWY